MGGLGSVKMTNHLCALVEDWLEKRTEEFVLAGFIDVMRVACPHVGDDDDVLQRCITAKLTEHLEISSRDSGESDVGDSVDVDNPSELRPFFVSVRRLNPEDQETTSAGMHLRSGQESGNPL